MNLVNTNQKGSSSSLPAHGRAEARKRKMPPPKIPSVPARTRRKGGVEGIPPRPSGNYQNSASGFSRKKVRILFRRDSTLLYSRFLPVVSASPPSRWGGGSAPSGGKFPRHSSPTQVRLCRTQSQDEGKPERANFIAWGEKNLQFNKRKVSQLAAGRPHESVPRMKDEGFRLLKFFCSNQQ